MRLQKYLKGIYIGMPSKLRRAKSAGTNYSVAARSVRVFRTGGSVAVRIPRELQFPDGDLMIARVQEGLLITPAPRTRSVAEWWGSWEADPAFMADGRRQPAAQVRDFGT